MGASGSHEPSSLSTAEGADAAAALDALVELQDSLDYQHQAVRTLFSHRKYLQADVAALARERDALRWQLEAKERLRMMYEDMRSLQVEVATLRQATHRPSLSPSPAPPWPAPLPLPVPPPLALPRPGCPLGPDAAGGIVDWKEFEECESPVGKKKAAPSPSNASSASASAAASASERDYAFCDGLTAVRSPRSRGGKEEGRHVEPGGASPSASSSSHAAEQSPTASASADLRKRETGRVRAARDEEALEVALLRLDQRRRVRGMAVTAPIWPPLVMGGRSRTPPATTRGTPGPEQSIWFYDPGV
ncbi:unnamed protein product [Vitrella brassicaformis CCMP3155]|uniref:Uncharacterized protein n=2 Tax=Vitrella brassicaformis TaxID=1169539 RepID=A0A0G4FNZ7_VITBC|nr:unnamed protein product [Vitrella brassicaformis CCMP3155]|eukprot:CEM15788.1 unnamed protein product [Vitrella brassicaformis CCMP3155]